ncbi:MAG: glutamate racemase [Candidatus Woesebacteria bacterium]|nr:glutamate racemase [Candidatus Woesebacteria bacterium]
MNNKAIGIFDSGLGGLTVVKEIIKVMPYEDIVYLGDTARVPYGTRSKETIIKFSFEDANFLLQKNIKCLIIACNTSSALAGAELKKKLEILVFDVITPALKEAKEISKSGKIGVIGTRGTIGSGAYSVPFSKACPLFVPFIEEGETEGDAIEIVAKNYLADFKKDNIDTLILGCTHYPIIKDVIKREVNNDVKLIDPGKAVAKEILEYLNENKMLNVQETKGKKDYFVTDLTERFTKVAEMFLGEKIQDKLKKVVLTK